MYDSGHADLVSGAEEMFVILLELADLSKAAQCARGSVAMEDAEVGNARWSVR